MPGALQCRQHRKPLPCPAQVQKVGITGLGLHGTDPCRDRPAAAYRNHVGNDILGPGKYRLDAAVAAIANPAFEAARDRMLLDPRAVADALHAAADGDVADYAAHVFRPRNSALRALVSASRIARPVSPDEAMPLRFFGEVPSRNAFSVS